MNTRLPHLDAEKLKEATKNLYESKGLSTDKGWETLTVDDKEYLVDIMRRSMTAYLTVAQPEPKPNGVEAMSRVMHPESWSLIDQHPDDELSVHDKHLVLARAEKLAHAYVNGALPQAEKITDAEWHGFQSIPDQGYSHREWIDARITERVAAAQLEANRLLPTIENFINDRPEYITALKGTRGTEDQSNYWRWSGGAEARGQLASRLGWTVPHEPGEITRPVVPGA